jgi:hypothetical protein
MLKIILQILFISFSHESCDDVSDNGLHVSNNGKEMKL